MKLLTFIASAIYHRKAYIDLDGCLLKRFDVPWKIKVNRLQWWHDNLQPTPLIRRRLLLLYVLRAFGVKLHIWTNRSQCHIPVTLNALGDHVRLFESGYFTGGRKELIMRDGPCMDDQPQYIRRQDDYKVKTL